MKGERIVFDVEIAKPVGSLPKKWDSTELMGIGVASVYSFDRDRFTFYEQRHVGQLKERLEAASEIVSFNGWSFDLPVVYGLSKTDWRGLPGSIYRRAFETKSNDLLRRIWIALRLNPDEFVFDTHGGFGLNDVCKATIGRGKIGDGAQAPLDLIAGKIAEVYTYCQDDVCLTRDLCQFIDRFGYCYSAKKPNLRVEFNAAPFDIGEIE